jgi:hypothetical protein
MRAQRAAEHARLQQASLGGQHEVRIYFVMTFERESKSF